MSVIYVCMCITSSPVINYIMCPQLDDLIIIYNKLLVKVILCEMRLFTRTSRFDSEFGYPNIVWKMQNFCSRWMLIFLRVCVELPSQLNWLWSIRTSFQTSIIAIFSPFFSTIFLFNLCRWKLIFINGNKTKSEKHKNKIKFNAFRDCIHTHLNHSVRIFFPLKCCKKCFKTWSITHFMFGSIITVDLILSLCFFYFWIFRLLYFNSIAETKSVNI